MRPLLVLFHRYVGLVMAGFLILAGLTGMLLVWNHELDAALNPRLMLVAPSAASKEVLDPLLLRERVEQAWPHAWVHYVPLRQPAAGEAMQFYIEPRPDASGRASDLDADQVFVDPYTGRILGTRRWGDISQGTTNLMPFIYRLHYSLALGTVGTWAFGIVALLWTIDCFVGAWLTLPASGRTRLFPARQWWARWAPAWQIRWRAGSYKLNFDLHRAGGLWPWALLLVLAWSSVAFNLYQPVYLPLMRTVFGMADYPRTDAVPVPLPADAPSLGWPQAREFGRRHMAREADRQGFSVVSEDRMAYDAHKNYVRYVVRSDRDLNERYGQTSVYFDATTGALLATRIPTGQNAGETITSWITTLHMAHIWGLPFRVLMTATGLVVAILSVTGVVIWWRKRQARRKSLQRIRSLTTFNSNALAPATAAINDDLQTDQK